MQFSPIILLSLAISPCVIAGPVATQNRAYHPRPWQCAKLAVQLRSFHSYNDKLIAEREKERTDAGEDLDFELWPIDGLNKGKTRNYHDYFKPSLDGLDLDAWADARHKEGKATHVGDFFGSAVFTEHPDKYTSLTGIRLKKIDPSAVPRNYLKENWEEVTQDSLEKDLTPAQRIRRASLLRPKIWNVLDTRMANRQIPSFDLILCRPEGPLYRTAGDFVNRGEPTEAKAALAIYQRVVSRMWKRLNHEDGTMLVQLTRAIYEHPLFREWTKRLDAAKIEVTLFDERTEEGQPGPILRLRRNSKSANDLPN